MTVLLRPGDLQHHRTHRHTALGHQAHRHADRSRATRLDHGKMLLHPRAHLRCIGLQLPPQVRKSRPLRGLREQPVQRQQTKPARAHCRAEEVAADARIRHRRDLSGILRRRLLAQRQLAQPFGTLRQPQEQLLEGGHYSLEPLAGLLGRGARTVQDTRGVPIEPGPGLAASLHLGQPHLLPRQFLHQVPDLTDTPTARISLLRTQLIDRGP